MLCKKVGGTKIPRNESSEQKVHALSRGTKVPGNAWSREQTFSIGTIRSWEWKVWGTKSPGTPVSSNDVPKWYFTYQSRIRNSMYRNWYHMYRRYRWLWLILVDHFSILCCTFCGWLCSSHCPHGVGLLRAVTLYPVMGFMRNCPNLLYKKLLFSDTKHRMNEVYSPVNRIDNGRLPVEAEAHQSWSPKQTLKTHSKWRNKLTYTRQTEREREKK